MTSQSHGASSSSGLRPEEVPSVDDLDVDECWKLLQAQPVGRLAVRTGDGVDIFPVNFVVTDRKIYLRSAPGAKLVDIAHASGVAFEADGKRRGSRWSVVVHGEAERMSYDTDIQDSGVLDLPTMTSSAKWNYIRIAPVSITGIRFTRSKRVG
jgi:nitroimidazol reductase NimA-like FMN-containing flavoprotein (pyridoxamine 5'-phosphate oxidase superfamily)